MHALILHQKISFSSLTVGKTSLWGGWKSLAIRTCGHLGYSAICPQPWSWKAVNCKTFALSLAPLPICRSNLNSQRDVDLMPQLRETASLLEAPGSEQRPRVRRYGLKILLCIFCTSSGGFHDRVSEMSLMATSYAKYHKLTKVARNYFSHYDKTSENCGP